jgi:hypothetical protein
MAYIATYVFQVASKVSGVAQQVPTTILLLYISDMTPHTPIYTAIRRTVAAAIL